MLLLHPAALQLRAVKRATRDRGVSLRRALAPLSERLVFVFGSPRSGTTFLAGAIGSCPGFVDIGEVAPLKAAIPELVRLDTPAAAWRIRRILDRTRRLATVGDLRAVEQTPETAYVAAAVVRAFPRARLVHIVRDGRDVVCSLLERGWLSPERTGTDDAGLGYGPHARFWVEHGREGEFAQASDVRRAAWAWRRYVAAARSAPDRLVEVRYEDLVANPSDTAHRLAVALDAPEPLLTAALGHAHADSVSRFRRDLTDEQITEVEEEAGTELRLLGYLQ